MEENILTPAMKQYFEIKENYSDCIIFFRMWDFYEMFLDDANIAHKVLWIAITSRNKNSKEPMALAWFPYHAKEKYLPLLANAWYKIAIVEQVSDPKLKWIVKREVVRVVTPATLALEWENYTTKSNVNNVILSIYEENWIYSISFIDIWTNKWKTSIFENFDKLKQELYKISPLEVILDKKLFDNKAVNDILLKKYSLNIYYFEATENARNKLINHFWVKNLEWFWIENKILAQKSSSLLLEYLEKNQKSNLSFLNNLSFETFSDFMDLDETTLKSLDILYNVATKSNSVGTLFWVLNKTKTSWWTRFLREQLLKPLKDIEKIKERQDFIEDFYNNKILLEKVRENLKHISDIDLILNRLALNRANPRDLLNLKNSLKSILEIFELIEKSWSERLKKIVK